MHALGLAVIVALAAGTAMAQQSGPTAVTLATVKATMIADRVNALGTVRANEAVTITATVTEKIAEIRFDDGDAVGAGDILVVLEKDEEEAELKAALATLTEQRLAFERVRELESRNVAAAAQVDERRAALEAAEARVEVIRSRIADRIVRAPFAGTVGLRDISLGTLVQPGDPIITLDDQSVVKVDFSVPASHLDSLRPGLPIRASVPALGEYTFTGTIRSIGTRVDPVTRSITARARIPNPDGRLKPGLLMTVELFKNERRALVIPEEALIPRGRDNFVLVVETDAGNRVSERAVEIGSREPGRVEIRRGLEEGERVIIRGTLLVRPGQTVAIVGEEDAGTEPEPPAGAAE